MLLQKIVLKSRVSEQLPPKKMAPRELGLGFGLRLTFELGLGGDFPRG